MGKWELEAQHSNLISHPLKKRKGKLIAKNSSNSAY